MRIRKRQVPFPLSPVTLSDPHLVNRSPVVVQLNDATTTSPKPSFTHGSATAPISLLDRPQPSDQPLPPIGKPSHGCDDSSGKGGAHGRQQKKQECLVEDGSGQEGGGGQKGNDTRKGGILGSEIPAEVFSPSSPSKQDGRWCEREKAIPLEKRRGDFDKTQNNSYNDSNNNNKKKMKMKMKMKSRMKTKMNKKCLAQDDSIEGEEDDDDKDEEVRETKPDVNVSKKRVRGSTLMEGSRCSRVNGTGWRCCQQTLVGYSLCEHHLGKGGIRSMTRVRNGSIATSSTAPKKLHEPPLSGASSSPPEKQTKCVTDPLANDGEDNDEKNPLMITKKRMKLGMVKARSISSLLGQKNTEIAVAENNK